MTLRFVLAFSAFVLVQQGIIAQTPSTTLTRALSVKPSPAELRWQQIPWEKSLAEARKKSIVEKRPLLLWGSDDDPLDRC